MTVPGHAVQQIATATMSPLGDQTLHTLLDALDAASAALDAAPREPATLPPAPTAAPARLTPVTFPGTTGRGRAQRAAPLEMNSK